MKNVIILVFLIGIAYGQQTNVPLPTPTMPAIKAELDKLNQKMDQLSLTNIQANLLEISNIRESLEALKDRALKQCQKKELKKDDRKQCLLGLKTDYFQVIETYYKARLKYLDVIHKHYQNLLGQERQQLLEQLNKETL